jgi:uncharacterized membrane protein
MGYREDPEARADLKAAVTGFFGALAFLLVVGGITFFWAKNATPHHAGGETPAASSQH